MFAHSIRQRGVPLAIKLGGVALAALICAMAPVRADTTSTPLDAVIGKSLFERIWVSAPASTKATDGLGPLFNARSCAACHPGGGRAEVSVSRDGEVEVPGLVARFTQGAGRVDPIYGRQLQTSAVQGQTPEGRLYKLSGGVGVAQLTGGPLHPETRVSGRLAPQLHGLALLAAFDPSLITRHADPDDENNDGISGRAHWIVDDQGKKQLGRFGWRAAHTSLRSQSAEAFLVDLGLSTSLFPAPAGDCTNAQAACLNGPHGDPAVEIPDSLLDLVTTYLENLPPPQATPDPEGETLFVATGCAACHIPALAKDAQDVPPAYTDLLLHDMGGALSAPAAVKEIAATEWRTAPLWGMSRAIAQNSGFLHDGRASTIGQAIEFHGGEAERARQAFQSLSSADQQVLLTFVETR